MKKVLLINLFVLASQLLFANNFTCTIKNIKQPINTNNILEFDIYVHGTSNQTLQFQSLQAGVNFNYNELANGGVITGSFVKNSGDERLKGAQANPNWNINPATKQIRLLAAIQTSNKVAVALDKTGIKVGTFRMVNTVPFASVKPNFTWSFVTGSNITKSAVTSFVNAKVVGEALTTQKSFSFENQGPEYFVESNPVINNKPSSITSSTIKESAEGISVYPNPVRETLKVDVTSTKNEVVLVKIIDNSGRIVKEIQQDLTVGTKTINMNVQELANGNYFVQVYRNGVIAINKQLIKQ